MRKMNAHIFSGLISVSPDHCALPGWDSIHYRPSGELTARFPHFTHAHTSTHERTAMVSREYITPRFRFSLFWFLTEVKKINTIKRWPSERFRMIILMLHSHPPPKLMSFFRVSHSRKWKSWEKGSLLRKRKKWKCEKRHLYKLPT